MQSTIIYLDSSLSWHVWNGLDRERYPPAPALDRIICQIQRMKGRKRNSVEVHPYTAAGTFWWEFCPFPFCLIFFLFFFFSFFSFYPPFLFLFLFFFFFFFSFFLFSNSSNFFSSFYHWSAWLVTWWSSYIPPLLQSTCSSTTQQNSRPFTLFPYSYNIFLQFNKIWNMNFVEYTVSYILMWLSVRLKQFY